MLPRLPMRALIAASLLLLLGTGGIVLAQIEGANRGVAAADDSGSFEVGGIDVDVYAKNTEAARYGGWRIAQRKGWEMLAKRLGSSAGSVSDSTLDGLVSGIVVEREDIGPRRYVARLGVLFDRNRAGALLGVAGQISRSPPLLLVPLIWSGGSGEVFEQRTEWQQAWARFRTGSSMIDYVRPTGTGPDALLLNSGQIGRPGRVWWRTILDQYGAKDVLIPVVQIYHEWPGGPVIGVFQARYGPDNRFLTRFTLRVANSDALPVLLDAGVKRIDEAYQDALNAGTLQVDPSLLMRPPGEPVPEETDAADETVADAPVVVSTGGSLIMVQFDTPGASAVTSTEAAIRGVPGVESADTTSLALGGVSVMRVRFDGDIAALRAAFEARGWQVQAGTGAIRIRRPAGPALPTPVVPPDNATSG